MIALLEARGAGLLSRSQWLRNIVAGLVVGVAALPLAMAFAIASGAKPEQGLYTAIVASVVVSLFGGSRVQIAGPTGAFVVILAGITARYGVDGLQIATLLAGVILLLLGIARLGAIIKFIPDPVIAGFTAGIAVIIWTNEWQDFFGLPAVTGQHFHEKLWHLLQVFPQFHLATTALATLALVVVVVTPRLPLLKRVPGPLMGLLVATVIQATMHYPGVATIGSTFGGIPAGLPSLHIPHVTAARVIELIGPAFAIAMLGAIESLLSAVVADGMAGTRHDSNQELIGQGVANILTPLFGGFAATGAIARTATNIRSGARSPIAAFVHALIALAAVVLAAPLLGRLPMAALAALLLYVAWNMAELDHFAHVLKVAPRSDVAVLLTCFLLTVVVDMVMAVSVGVVMAALLFMRRMAEVSSVRLVDEHPMGLTRKLPRGVVAYEIAGPLFFGAAQKAVNVVGQVSKEEASVVLNLSKVPVMDATGLVALETMLAKLRRGGVKTVLAGVNAQPAEVLERAGIRREPGVLAFAPDLDTALSMAIVHTARIRRPTGSTPAAPPPADTPATS